MHDGLRFAEDAIADLLRRHGHDAETDRQAHRRLMEPTELLRELADRQAITALIHGYCFHFDNNEPEAVAALFTRRRDGRLRPGGGHDRRRRSNRRDDRRRARADLRGDEPSRLEHRDHVRRARPGRVGRLSLRVAPLRRRLARRRALGTLPPRLRPNRGRLADQPARAPGGRNGRLPPGDDVPDRPPLSFC